MKNLSILVMLLMGIVSNNSNATIGSCVKTSDPQSGTISVLYCDVPQKIVIFECNTNDTPTVTPNCSCPMPDPISVYIPSSCEEIDSYVLEDHVEEYLNLIQR